MESTRYDQMQVEIFESDAALGAGAARDMAAILQREIAERGQAAIILATGNSQRSFIETLREMPGIAWNKISIFHMDEYLGMDEHHPASFRRWMRERLLNYVQPRNFFGVEGDAADVEAELARYAALLNEHQPVACALGIGENGHLAFNDPPADFNHPQLIHIVTLDERSRRQQVGEGHFPTLDAVPRQALSLTIPALLRPRHVLAIVPERRKAQAVKAALHGPLTPDCPASILRTLPHVKLYLDRESSALL